MIGLPWSRSSRRLPTLVVRPLQSFLETEAAGGVFLLAAAVAALVWANIGHSYERVWTQAASVNVGSWGISMDLRHWVTDGLMAVFFFVVGLEIKRELTTGELRDRRVATLPIAAALGGMAAPALLYLALNAGGAGAHGWGIPMATDIAFALGVLIVAGKGLPPSLRAFLLALAIVDDIGAILVIAVFYSRGISLVPLAVAGCLLLLMAGAHRVHIRSMAFYGLVGVAVWVAVYESGVHATIAGVVLGLLTPAAAFQRPRAVSDEAHRIADETTDEPWPPDVDAPQWLRLAALSKEAVSPLARLESVLHPWSSFVIVPLFALANAGIVVSGGAIREAFSSPVTLGVVLGLVVGKAVGISGGAWLANTARLASLPTGVRWRHIVAVAVTAGIGFTVSLLMADLAFRSYALIEAAKVGILAGSTIAAVAGWFLLKRAGRARVDP